MASSMTSSALIEIKIEPESDEISQQPPVEIEIKLEPVDPPGFGYQMYPESIGVPPHERAEVKAESESVDAAPAVPKVEPQAEDRDNVELKNEESCGSHLLGVETFNVYDVKFEVDGDNPLHAGLDAEMAATPGDGVNKDGASGADKQKQAEGEIIISTAHKAHQCDVCDRQFQRLENLKLHYRTHTGEKPFQCEVCRKLFGRRDNLLRHKISHTSEKPFQCEMCEKRFKSRSDLSAHMTTHTREKPFQCQLCHMAFPFKSKLSIHMSTHSGEKPFLCNVCQKAFGRSDCLSRHMRTHIEEPFLCNTCQRTFKSRRELVIHTTVHTGEKLFQCEVCQKTFTLRSYLTAHMSTHTGEKPFQCDMCHKAFGRRYHLSRHLHTHTSKQSFGQKYKKKKRLCSVEMRN